MISNDLRWPKWHFSDYIEQTSKQMSTEITKIGFEKCLGQLTKSKDKVLDTLKRDEQNLADARKTLQKAKNENDRRCKERF